MKNEKLNILVKVSMLGVIAFLLMFIEIPLPIFPSFLQIDISDLPALIGAFAMGPVAGVIIELLKNILHGLFKGGTAFIGEFANFAVGSVMVIITGYLYNKNKSKKTAIMSLILGTVIMSIAAAILNYTLLLPLYEKVLGFPIKAVVAMGNKINPSIKDLNSFVVLSILPFNLLKGALVSAITMAVYKSVSPVLHDDTFAQSKAVKEN